MSGRIESVGSVRSVAFELYELLKELRPELADGVAAILGELDASDQIGAETALRNARSIYRTMTGGAGGLLDAFIAHPDEQEQARVNAELEVRRRELGQLLEASRQTGKRR